jgi:hypothetical protein
MAKAWFYARELGLAVNLNEGFKRSTILVIANCSDQKASPFSFEWSKDPWGKRRIGICRMEAG